MSAEKPSIPTTPEALVEALAKLGWHRAKTASDRYSLWDAPGGAWGRILVPEDADSLGYDAALERAVSQFRRLTAAPVPAPSVVPEAAVEVLTEWGVDESDVAALREAAVEAVAWKLIDRTSDLADRAPSDETWRTANADARAALPLLTAAPSATREEVETEWRVEVRADDLIYGAEFDTEANARKAWADQPDGVLMRVERARWTHDPVTPKEPSDA